MSVGRLILVVAAWGGAGLGYYSCFDYNKATAPFTAVLVALAVVSMLSCLLCIYWIMPGAEVMFPAAAVVLLWYYQGCVDDGVIAAEVAVVTIYLALLALCPRTDA